MKKILGFFIFLLLLLVAGVSFYLMADRTKPEVLLVPDVAAVSAKKEFTVTAKSPRSGVKSLRVTVNQGQKDIVIVQKKFSPAPKTMTEKFTLENAGLREGAFELSVAVQDNSIFNFGDGNTERIAKTLNLDSKPPVVAVLSTAHYIKPGGADAVVYAVNKPVARSGVQVGDDFFPGFRLDSGNYVCIYAMPYGVDPAKFNPKLMAEDTAGNEKATLFRNTILPRKFRSDRINISDEFLTSKMPQFYDIYPDIKDPVELYIKVNGDLRIKNLATLHQLGAQSAPRMLWEGAFLRLPNAKPMAGYGDHREYYYKDRKIDEETHLGVDLASLEHAQVPAANTGRVVFTGFFGIYGETVIIDHGLGVQTLYSHLSQIVVKEGDLVKKGDQIGFTGATGLAGGDHLHFGVVLSGVEVMPIEWWDAHWIQDNITGKFQ
jgi:murein DD-endopeptidase MepM/ murein hydrolase activator NlpD